MKRKAVWLLVLALVAFLANFAISGISFQSTLTGMRQVVQGAPGTFVMAKDNLFMLAWPAGENAWAFACITKAGNPIKDLASYVNGTKVDTLTMASFLNDLETDGWQMVSEKTLPAGITGALTSYMSFLMSIGARSMPDLLVVPAVILGPAPVPTMLGVQQ